MSNLATIKVSSAAAAVDARSSAYPSTWQPCAAAVPTVKATQAIRVRMHGNGFLTARRPKERSSP
jgi:hypothetical protein